MTFDTYGVQYPLVQSLDLGMIIFGHVRSLDSLDVIWTCSHVAAIVIFPDAIGLGCDKA